MRLTILTMILGTIFFFSCGNKTEKSDESAKIEMKQSDSLSAMDKKVYYYTCPMDKHKHIHSENPGKCTECGMQLIAAEETMVDSMDYYGCPMASHSHIRHDKAGKCEECGMELKPMQLDKK
jgi:ferredoxin-like protein FixX